MASIDRETDFERELTADGQPALTTPIGHIRNSALGLLGRVLHMVIDFVLQVAIVRYLTKDDYGAFAYALAIISVSSTFVVFAMDKTVARFAPIYHERRDYDRMYGTIVMMIGLVVLLGVAVVVGFLIVQDWIAASFVHDPRVMTLLVIVIVLAPIQALTSLLGSSIIVFVEQRRNFWRRQLLPVVQLAVILVLIAIGADVYAIAWAYVILGAVRILFQLGFLARRLSRQGLLQHFHPRQLQMPFREVFSFSLPLLSSDLVFVLRSSLVVLILGAFQPAAAVAAFRAVQPVARQNMLVYQPFSNLFMPSASRLFAREHHEKITELYWQTAMWIAVATFPIFAITFSLAQPLTVLLFGEKYADSGIIMALLALGYYFNAALGPNGMTLRVFGRVRSIVLTDVIGSVLSVAVYFLLIPPFGPLGAAVGLSATLILQNLMYQLALWRGTGIPAIERSSLKVYGTIVAGAGGLFLLASVLRVPAVVSFASAALVSLLVVVVNREHLKVAEAFPKLARFPLVRRLLPS